MIDKSKRRAIYNAAVERLSGLFDNEGSLADDSFFYAADEIHNAIVDNPHRIGYVGPAAVASAVWYLTEANYVERDEVSPNCIGARLFLAFYQAGRLAVIRKMRDEEKGGAT